MPCLVQGDHNQYQKKKIGLSFRKVRCLGHLGCVQTNHENFVQFGSHNAIFWCCECTHILVVGQMALSPSVSLLRCKLCHVPPFVSLIVVDESIMLCINSSQSQKSSDSSFMGFTNILLQMASARRLWMRLKGGS
jgi:hypothetical protein